MNQVNELDWKIVENKSGKGQYDAAWSYINQSMTLLKVSLSKFGCHILFKQQAKKTKLKQSPLLIEIETRRIRSKLLKSLIYQMIPLIFEWLLVVLGRFSFEPGTWDSLLPQDTLLSPPSHQEYTACLFLLFLRSHVDLSLSFSHSQTTLVLIKPRGLTFSPRYLGCCTKSIFRS